MHPYRCRRTAVFREYCRRSESGHAPLAGQGAKLRSVVGCRNRTKSPAGDRTVANVSDPTLTVFLSDAARATGTAVVIAPGEALRALAYDGVSAGFGMSKRGLPLGTWTDRLYEWLVARKITTLG